MIEAPPPLILASPPAIIRPVGNLWTPPNGHVGAMLPGLAPCAAAIGGAVAPVSISQTDTGTAAAVAGVATFATRAIGAAAADRYVIVALTTESNIDIIGTTISGSSANIAAFAGKNTGPSPDITSAIYWRLVPTGTTATVTVGFASSNTNNVGITVLRLVGGTGLVFSGDGDSAAGAANSPMDFDVPSSSGSIFVVGNDGTGAITWSGSAVTAAAQFTLGADRHACVYRTDAMAASLSVDCSAGVNRAFCGASFA